MQLLTCGTLAKLSAVSAVSNLINFEEKVRQRIAEVGRIAPGSIGEMMHFQVTGYDPDHNDIWMTCETMLWMCNSAGTLHGGMCATILDQAMGFVSHCLKAGEGIAPAVQLKVDFHRPLHPGERAIVKVHVVSETRSLMHLTAEAFQVSSPEKICLSGSGIYFHKSGT